MKRPARLTIGAAAAAVLTCIALMASAISAVAADAPYVSGVDNYATSGSVKILSVDGSAGDSIFVDVANRSGKVLASHNLFSLKNGENTGVVTMNVGEIADNDRFTVRAYADRSETKLLYEGAVVPVFARFDNGAPKLMGTRTVSTSWSPVQDSARAFVPEETVAYEGADYKLVRDVRGNAAVAVSDDGAITVSYASYTPGATVSGSISYVNDSGSVVATQVIPGIARDSSSTVAVPSAVKGDDGGFYRTVYFEKSITAYNPGQHDYVIHVKPLSISGARAANYYIATINLVDEKGKVLASDSVDVTGTYVYTAPTVIYETKNGAQASYKLVNSADQVLALDASTDNETGGAKTYTITYAKQESVQGAVTGQFNLVNGTKRVNDEGRNLGVQSFTVTADDPIATPTQETIDVDGKTYTIAGGASRYAYDLASGKSPVIDVYYVPSDYVAPGPYEVKVQYVNLANNSVISTKTVTASPDQTEDLEIATDETIDVDGVSYVRLDGQEEPIYHNYYSAARTYTVYYRDVNDDLHAKTVITRVRVSYEGGTTVPISAGAATGTSDAAATDAGATPAGALNAALNAGRVYNAINGNDGGLLTNEEGIDSNTERIEENANPLASGVDEQKPQLVGVALPLGIGVAVAIAAVIAFVVVQRRKRRKADMTAAK